MEDETRDEAAEKKTDTPADAPVSDQGDGATQDPPAEAAPTEGN